jgi:hypothetical protein
VTDGREAGLWHRRSCGPQEPEGEVISDSVRVRIGGKQVTVGNVRITNERNRRQTKQEAENLAKAALVDAARGKLLGTGKKKLSDYLTG